MKGNQKSGMVQRLCKEGASRETEWQAAEGAAHGGGRGAADAGA